MQIFDGSKQNQTLLELDEKWIIYENVVRRKRDISSKSIIQTQRSKKIGRQQDNPHLSTSKKPNNSDSIVDIQIPHPQLEPFDHLCMSQDLAQNASITQFYPLSIHTVDTPPPRV
ncbi:hypothetical protein DICVIV_01560 [Dictyocaulus viviparus]|uniref:Uncharacterized protein n=1 Tax=Dictyocaulus viviparus TaxID=29172 RepID=A0A0D8Y7S6_DICVI|nr:hypothetical protein DICVIV_01560 [Dictyocaulus viviparus]